MKYFKALVLSFVLILITTLIEFSAPNSASFINPFLVVICAILFWRFSNMRWFFFLGIIISFIPEFQSQILGPLELHHFIVLLCWIFWFVPWVLFAPIKLSRLSVTLALYYSALIIVSLINFSQILSWHRLSIVFFMILIALLFPQYVRTKKDFKEFIGVIIGLTVCISIFALGALYFSHITGNFFENPYLHMSTTEGVPRVRSVLLDSNFLGNFLLIALPFLIYYLGTRWTELANKKRIFLFLIVLLSGSVFLLTYSRSAYLGLLASIIVLALIIRNKRSLLRAFLILASILVTTCLIYPPFLGYSIYRTPSILISTEQKEKILLGFDPRKIVNDYRIKIQNNRRLTDDEKEAVLARDVSSDSLGYRIMFWKAGLTMFKDHPLFGVGVGQFRYQFKDYASVEFIRQPDTHNIYIEQLAETGLFGFSLFMAVLVLTSLNFIRAIRKKEYRAVAIWGLASFLGILVQSFLLGNLGVLPIYLFFGLSSFLENSSHTQNKNKKTRLVFITATTKSDGPGNMLGLLISNLDRKQFEPIVISILSGGDWDQEYEERQVTRINLGLKKPFDLFAPILLWWHLAKLKPDLVHTQMIRADLYGRWAAHRVGAPVVTVVHNIDNWKRSRRFPHRLLTWLDKEGLRSCCHVAAVSQAVKNYLVDRQGITWDSVTVIPNGIDLSKYRASDKPLKFRENFRIPENALLIGTTARVALQKAPEIWLAAAIKVLEQKKEVHFIWAGDGPLLKAMQEMIKKRNLDERIHLIGKSKEIPVLLSGLDLYVLPSRFEGLPLSLIEAMACGLPCIATAVSGNPEIITDKKTGLLVDPEDSTALSQAILYLIDHPDERKILADNGCNFVRANFSDTKMAIMYETVYRKVLAKLC